MLHEPIEAACNLLVSSLLQGRRVYCCGEGLAHATSRHFAHIMLTGLSFERPPFPVTSLHADYGALDYDRMFAQQIQAVGQSDDVLVVFFLTIRPPPISTLFPYTTLFRSLVFLDQIYSRARATIALFLQYHCLARSVRQAPGRRSAKCYPSGTIRGHRLCGTVTNGAEWVAGSHRSAPAA